MTAITRLIFKLVRRVTRRRVCDQVIGGWDNPYLKRWYLIPRNPVLNIYVHRFLRSDDDRALHDHPWANISYLLDGEYTEHRILAGGVQTRTIRRAGDICMRLTGKLAHRIELHDGPCWTIFITGPRYRSWGFHCPEAGWIHWKKFVAEQVRSLVERVAKLPPTPVAEGDAPPTVTTSPERAISIARTDLQTGFMWLIRSIARPTTF